MGIKSFFCLFSTEAHKRYGGMGTMLVIKVGSRGDWFSLIIYLNPPDIYHTTLLFFEKCLFFIVYISPPCAGFCWICPPVWWVDCWSKHQRTVALHREAWDFCTYSLLFIELWSFSWLISLNDFLEFLSSIFLRFTIFIKCR